MIDRVTPTLVYSYVAGLSGEQPVMVGGNAYTILNRNTDGGEGIQHATQYAYERFASAGLVSSYHVWKDATPPNVIAEQPGVERPKRIFMLTAHLDDMPIVGPGTPVAPGADDNASGSAGVLIAAELLSQSTCWSSLRYALFTGEEQGLWGSSAYAASISGEDIRGVLNLDMIGWESDGDPQVDLYVRRGYGADQRIADFFTRVVDAYDLDLVPEVIDNGMGRSDHASFWGVGIPAILAIEDLEDFNLYYHTPNDRLSFLDIDYLTNFVKASIGVLAHMACLAPIEIFLPETFKNPASSR